MCTCVFSAVQNLGRPYWLTLSPMYLWMLVFFTRPHKEERFLFPIYPLICLSGAVALSSLQVCDILKRSTHMYTHTCIVRLTVFILLFAEMLPLPVPAISTGTLHCFLKLVGSKCSCGLCSVVPVSLCRPLQGCVTTVFFFSSWISKKKKEENSFRE